MSTANLLTISTVPADTVPAGTLQLVARWKSTDKRPISADRMRRAVILPVDIWRGASGIHSDSKPLELFMLDAVEDLAREYLSAIVEESNWLRAQVPQSDFTVNSLLTWNGERAALAGRLNGDEIRAWVATSATVSAIRTTHGGVIAAALGDQLVKLAAPNHGITPERAGKLLAGVWKQEDADSTTGLRVMLRLTAISNKQVAAADLLASIW